MHLRVDYEAIAAGYDRLYLRNDYSGVEQSLTEFVGRHVPGLASCSDAKELNVTLFRVTAYR